MKQSILFGLFALMLGGCETLLNVPVGPAETSPSQQYDKTVDTQTVRDCLDGSNDQSGHPDCFYQKRDQKDEAERLPPKPYIHPMTD